MQFTVALIQWRSAYLSLTMQQQLIYDMHMSMWMCISMNDEPW
jgi:hypothetical protein